MTGGHKGQQSTINRAKRRVGACRKGKAVTWYPMYAPEEAIRRAGLA